MRIDNRWSKQINKYISIIGEKRKIISDMDKRNNRDNEKQATGDKDLRETRGW